MDITLDMLDRAATHKLLQAITAKYGQKHAMSLACPMVIWLICHSDYLTCSVATSLINSYRDEPRPWEALDSRVVDEINQLLAAYNTPLRLWVQCNVAFVHDTEDGEFRFISCPAAGTAWLSPHPYGRICTPERAGLIEPGLRVLPFARDRVIS